jgi:hypothetical protein
MITHAMLSTMERDLLAAQHALEDRDVFGDDSRVTRAANVMQDAIRVVAEVKRLRAENFALAATQCAGGAPTVGGDFKCCCQTDVGALGHSLPACIERALIELADAPSAELAAPKR